MLWWYEHEKLILKVHSTMSSTLEMGSNCLGLKWRRPWILYCGEDVGNFEHRVGAQNNVLGR